MKKVVAIIISIFTLLSIHTSAFAYSYGDPNEEKIAEAYKQMVVKLDENPPNYKAAEEIYKTVQEEIDMHMGEEPSQFILKDFETKDKDKLITDMEKILVLNINRRLTNVDEKFADYSASKLLLAKAFATYEALSPVVSSKDKEIDTKLRDEFNKALEALGNPGLFGVGNKEADHEAFKQSKEVILKHLKTEFGITDFTVGHFGEESESKASEKTEWTDLSSLKNWLPILVIIAVLVAVVIYVARKRR